MSQDEHPTEVRTCTAQGENKGRNNALGRHWANRTPLRRQGATHKGSKTKSPFCVVLKTYHLDTGILHKTCLKHTNFPQQKTVCPIVTNMEHHGNSNGTGNRRENKTRKNELRQGSKHGNYNIFKKIMSCLDITLILTEAYFSRSLLITRCVKHYI